MTEFGVNVYCIQREHVLISYKKKKHFECADRVLCSVLHKLATDSGSSNNNGIERCVKSNEIENSESGCFDDNIEIYNFIGISLKRTVRSKPLRIFCVYRSLVALLLSVNFGRHQLCVCL